MKQTYLLLFLLCLLSSNAQEKKAVALSLANEKEALQASLPNFSLFRNNRVPAKEEYHDAVREGVLVDVNLDMISALRNDEIKLAQISFPLSMHKTVSVELMEVSIFAPGFRAVTSSGNDITDAAMSGKHFQGIVPGVPKSLVSLSVYKNQVIGFVSLAEGNYMIGPLHDGTKKHIIYNDKDLLKIEEWHCATEDDGVIYSEEEIDATQLSKDPGDCVNVYVEAGQSVYNSFGGNQANALAFLNAVFAQSYVLYANEGLTLQTSSLFLWTTPDPYTASSANDYRAQFQQNTPQNGFTGDIGHLVEVHNVGGQAAGFSGICNPNTDESLCFSGFSGTSYNSVPTYSFNVQIITHEMGHLLGSRHTHACVWNGNGTAIDGCAGYTEGGCSIPPPANPGTIMSYCHNATSINFVEGFHPQPSAVINNTVNNPGNCLTSCSAPSNDVCINAETINCGDIMSGSTTIAVFDNIGTCGVSNTAPGVWYAFTGIDGTATLSTCDQADFNTKISVFSGSCGTLVCEAGENNTSGCTGNSTEVTLCTQAGETYYVLVHGFQNETGNFNLSLTCEASSVNISCPPTAFVNGCSASDAVPFTTQSEFETAGGIISNAANNSFLLIDTAVTGTNPIQVTHTYEVADDCGFFTTCEHIVNVEDSESPTVLCQDITVSLNTNGEATITAADIDNGSSDNCGIDSSVLDVSTFDCNDVGQNTVTLTVTDTSGNTVNCTAVVTVEDTENPVAACQDIVISLDANGEATITPNDLDNGSSDNCGIDSLLVDVTNFDCSNIGNNTVTFTAVDANGNTSSCTAVVTVEDATNPILTCTDITVELDATGNASIIADDVIAANTDNCAIDTTSIDISIFDCTDVGTPVTVTVLSEDVNGNSTTCIAIVTVTDTIAPEITCPSNLQVIIKEGQQYELPDYFSNSTASATDNCTNLITNTTQTPAIGSMMNAGTHLITLSAEDNSGNENSCTFELTVTTELGINDENLSQIVLYPNPSNGELTLQNPNGVLINNMILFDVSGRKLKSLPATHSVETELDFSQLASGTYLFVISTTTGNLVKQIVIE